ncbi:MAG: phosphoglucosamine mutase [Candidatus Bathyarchaeota archaeon]|nr:phosphoglucosamine mutase [Candidatus Bathyarchaeota archaeon]
MGKLFGSSGVRGLANIDLTPELACKVAMATAACAKAKRAIIARDTRTSGLMLQDAIVAGLNASGVDVLLAGIVPTGTLAYATKALGADMGFMLTASHNPPQYNGIKIFRGDSLSYTDPEQAAVEKVVSESSFSLADWKKIGSATPVDVVQDYLKMALSAVSLKKAWRVVVDPGCGATYHVGPALLKAAGCKVTALNSQPDGHFPARKSEPNAETLKDLSATVKATGADIGVAFDGDGDRVAFVDERGVFVDLDLSLAAYSKYALKNSGGGIVVTNVEASMGIEKTAGNLGCRVVRSRVGDVYISEAINREGAVFGGEPCGAWVHPRQHLCPDGPLSALMFLAALESEGKSVSQFISEIPTFTTLRENLPVKNQVKYQVVAKLEAELKAAFPDFTDFSMVDGVRLALRSGWLLVRASGTEPLIRLTVEGESELVAKDLTVKATNLIQKAIVSEEP